MRLVDTREPDTKQAAIRTKLLETGWEQKALVSGDYAIGTYNNHIIGITRKTVQDLLQSIDKPKLARQLEEMLEVYTMQIWLIEGSWFSVNPARNIMTSRGVLYNTWANTWNYIRRWQDKGFTLELTADEGHTIQRLNEIYALYQKPYSLSARSKGYTDERILAFPTGCRGETGHKCLEHFGSLCNIADANIGQLLSVNGIGAKRAELIFHHFHRSS